MDALVSSSLLENVTWTGNKSVLTPFPVRLFLFACLHRGMPKLLLALAFCFALFFFRRREVITFFRALSFLELCYRIPYDWKYINLFLIGCWTTTDWKIYHQAFSVAIPIWSGRMAAAALTLGLWNVLWNMH